MPGKSVLEHAVEFVDVYVPQWFAREQSDPLFIYVSGPQGSGKTRASAELCAHLKAKYAGQYNVACVSIDDFYLTHADQLKLQEQYSGNELYRGRGMPGTHDMPLLNRVLQAVLQRRGDQQESGDGDGEESAYVHLPQYDKSLHGGAGDRLSCERRVPVPVDIFILEGWFLGFNPILSGRSGPETETPLAGDMVDVNAKLFMYSDLMWNNPEIHSLGIVLAADQLDDVYLWRVEQEHETVRESPNGEGMTDDEVRAFVDRYMPCYRLYYEPFVRSERLGSVATLTLGIDASRVVFGSKTRCIE
ncbi:putative ATP-dependent kinase KNAG_0G00760 [Huiozyma naganishii CBS 8797]|uniref:SRP54-type proteins GTP-binding domain-containing protein n=1 Tax=Huiozyma naganishii (strain ATCC MYA-139 / BCRC 22969 / CBS 8797 / KCTC 17520 / NBRC 10181 / NCYC 3082 / Yp74L-3) TaxID=1071383 RepID=J7S0S4_HUIN7|nr:hypothetical protein KNAG_0G00760 [Kazachstania naganishii CBS 8797]CCK71132.1 hypothetical protein KNAG_0G00760 [Kazachstania naganishii CBS 8797]